MFARGRYFNWAALDKLLAEAREDILARSPDPARSVRLELAGEDVARGRYNLFYEQYGDGYEEFLTTRDHGTYGMCPPYARWSARFIRTTHLGDRPRKVRSRRCTRIPVTRRGN